VKEVNSFEEVKDRLLGLKDFLVAEDKQSRKFDDEKWSMINNLYCELTFNKPRKYAELVKVYFKMFERIAQKGDGYVSFVINNFGTFSISEFIDDFIGQIPKHPECMTFDTLVNVDDALSRFYRNEYEKLQQSEMLCEASIQLETLKGTIQKYKEVVEDVRRTKIGEQERRLEDALDCLR
jgi:hypothetical protein